MILGRIENSTDRLKNENWKLRKKIEKLERQLSKTSTRLERAKEPRLSALKKRAWMFFSKWVRQNGGGICFTCRKPVEAAKGNAGHYIDSSICGAILNFHPRNVHLQCVTCNLWKHGNKAAYRINMVETYGAAKVGHLDQIRTKTVGVFKPTRQYYEAIARKYKSLADESKEGVR